MSDSSEGPTKGNGSRHSSRRNGRGRQAAPDVAFELWLERGLHQMYDNVASEPIPASLLNLIEQDRKKSSGNK